MKPIPHLILAVFALVTAPLWLTPVYVFARDWCAKWVPVADAATNAALAVAQEAQEAQC